MRAGRNRAAFLPLERVLCGLGVLLLVSWLAVHLDARLYQSRQMKNLDESNPAPGQTVVPEMIAPRSVIGKIEIPRLGLSAVVAEGTDAVSLYRAVGHLAGTALPGSPGNSVLAGHRDTYFRSLAGIEEEDTICVTTTYGRYVYRVIDKRIVPPSQTDVLSPSSSPMLTLVTCYPFRYIGSAPLRFVVQAKEIRPGS